jgi:hypothetical protein
MHGMAKMLNLSMANLNKFLSGAFPKEMLSETKEKKRKEKKGKKGKERKGKKGKERKGKERKGKERRRGS